MTKHEKNTNKTGQSKTKEILGKKKRFNVEVSKLNSSSLEIVMRVVCKEKSWTCSQISEQIDSNRFKEAGPGGSRGASVLDHAIQVKNSSYTALLEESPGDH